MKNIPKLTSNFEKFAIILNFVEYILFSGFYMESLFHDSHYGKRYAGAYTKEILTETLL